MDILIRNVLGTGLWFEKKKKSIRLSLVAKPDFVSFIKKNKNPSL